MSQNKGVLYLVATPLGNLADISQRALAVLQSVAAIAAEDTRHSRLLLNHYGIATPLIACHEHNENALAQQLLARLEQGEALALISDAGTPLISDPGFPLVRLARQAGITVTPVPGACAAIAALCGSGLPCDHFYFGGFLPRKAAARRYALEALLGRSETLVFYESSHRILECLEDIAAVFPAERPLVIARELTKRYETWLSSCAGVAYAQVRADASMQKGEFVLVVQGAVAAAQEQLTTEQARVLKILLAGGCSVKSAAAMAAEITGAARKLCYQAALAAAK